MKKLKVEKFANKCYILSGKKAFFHRFCDSGFRTKWTGFWSGSKKFLDYFAFKVDEEWLSPMNCYEMNYDGSTFTHFYSLNGIKVSETVFVPEEAKALKCFLKFKGEEEKEMNIFAEIGVNIRDREENWHDRKYWSRKHDNMLFVTSEKGCVALWFSRPFDVSGQEIYKDHFPGELQRCYIPGKISLKIKIGRTEEEILMILACGKNENEAVLNLGLARSSIEGKKRSLPPASFFKSNVNWLNELFKRSVVGLEKLKVESDVGFGYVAGLPWFTQFWGRDLGWCIPAIVDYGNFEDAKKCLETLMKFQSNDGEIPNFISLDGKTSFGSIDATPLWIIALTYYVENSGDVDFLKNSKKNLLRAVGWCFSKSENGLLEADKRSTWMDTLDRDGKPLEVQAIWYASLLSLRKLCNIFNEDIIDLSEIKEVEEKIEEFWNPDREFYFDRIKWKFKDEKRTVNAIFPLLFKVSRNPLKVLEKIESDEFTSSFGVRSLSKEDPEFNSSAYHKGSVWSWITGLVACIEFEYARPEKGLKYLEILNKMFDKNCLDSLDEAWDSENGNSILLKEHFYEPAGFFQAWGFASIVRCIDEFMLGIKIDALDKKIFISPSMLDGMKVIRKKRIGNDIVEMKIERNGNDLKVDLKSRAGKNYKIVKIPKI
ncbi:MAG: amylo-alpha-1,6-glucosidase [Candidatus Aenigmatarchaeota archaeon]